MQVAVAQEPSGPHIACDEPEYNFGTVSDVPEIRHVFVLKNTGDAPLNISRVRPTCGCTTAALASNRVQPGESVEVTATLSLQGRRGQQHKVIYVDCDDPRTPQYQLSLVGTIERQVDYTPQQAMLQISPSEPMATMDVQIVFRTPEPHTITDLVTNAPFCTAELKERRPGYEYTLTIATLPDLNVLSTYLTGNIALHTDHPSQPQINIPVVLHVMRDVVVAPNQLTISAALPPDTPFTQQILVRNRTPEPMQLLEVIAPTNGVTVTSHSLSPAMYRIEAIFTNPPRELNGQVIAVRVQRQGATEERYEVPIVITGN
ncbi:MAG: DUF1573 domain-containing protein [Lentisphaerae bacterium]|nr:DUF1573 domain-containing protein [Lentisphaerota bacterium]